MNVKDLREYLSYFPENAEVYFPRTKHAGTVKHIYMGKHNFTEGKVVLKTGYSFEEETIRFPDL